MTTLTKMGRTDYTAGSPGVPEIPGVPGVPAYCIETEPGWTPEPAPPVGCWECWKEGYQTVCIPCRVG